MDEGIARTNIQHFKGLLATETGEGKQKVLRKLLSEEELKLAALLKRKRKK